MAFNQERILYLLKNYTDRKATPEEERELMDWLADYEDDGSFQTHIRQLLNDYPAEKKAEGVDWERIYSAILAKRSIASPVAHRVHFLKTSWFRYAAAVVLLLGGAAVVHVFTGHPKEVATTNGNKHLQTDIIPGGDKAVLTLADGTKIILDNAQNGNLAQQGNTKIIKLTSGQLAYSPLQRGQGGLVAGSALYNTISTPRGGQYQIVLPDGTRVWLNAASSIKFPTAFGGSSRDVEMSGEAYMEIAKNPKQSFSVKASGTEIQVLGTSFNVNAYSDEETVRTTLIEGSVKVVAATDRGQQTSVLKPGEQCSVVSGRSSVVGGADIQQALAWKNGLFNFNNLSLQQILRQISRWYDLEVEYQGHIPSKKFSGEIQRDLNFSEALDVLKDAGVRFIVEGKKLIVLP